MYCRKCFVYFFVLFFLNGCASGIFLSQEQRIAIVSYSLNLFDSVRIIEKSTDEYLVREESRRIVSSVFLIKINYELFVSDWAGRKFLCLSLEKINHLEMPHDSVLRESDFRDDVEFLDLHLCSRNSPDWPIKPSMPVFQSSQEMTQPTNFTRGKLSFMKSSDHEILTKNGT